MTLHFHWTVNFLCAFIIKNLYLMILKELGRRNINKYNKFIHLNYEYIRLNFKQSFF